jgi:large subunit ribosomal protein L13e
MMNERLKAIVKSPKGKIREGRGFSISEIKQAGLSLKNAKKIGIPLDRRRKSCRKENINALKKFVASKL